MKNQLVLTNGLQGRFSDAETVDPAIQNDFHSFKLFRTDTGDLAGWLDFNGDLTATA